MGLSRWLFVGSVIVLPVLYNNCAGGFSSAELKTLNQLSVDTSSGSPNPTIPPVVSNPTPPPATPTPDPALKDLSQAKWSPINTAGAPMDNSCPSAVWNGSRMLVVGGTMRTAGDVDRTQVHSYDPKNDKWELLNTIPYASLRGKHSASAVWTGTTLLHWGGRRFATGCIAQGCWYPAGSTFNPVTLAFSEQSAFLNAADGFYDGRYGHAATWNGNKMIIYGGSNPFEFRNVAMAYTPSTNAWTVLAAPPHSRSFVSGAVFGDKNYYWGGANAVDHTSAAASGFTTGLTYDVPTNTWAAWNDSAPLTPRAAATMSATANQLVVWGGHINGTNFADGASYFPATKTWKMLPLDGAPSARECATSVWTGEEFIVWGGMSGGAGLMNGARLK